MRNTRYIGAIRAHRKQIPSPVSWRTQCPKSKSSINVELYPDRSISSYFYHSKESCLEKGVLWSPTSWLLFTSTRNTNVDECMLPWSIHLTNINSGNRVVTLAYELTGFYVKCVCNCASEKKLIHQRHSLGHFSFVNFIKHEKEKTGFSNSSARYGLVCLKLPVGE